MELAERKNRLRHKLAKARAELMTILQQVQPADATRSTENPLWTVRDLVSHLAVAEVGLQSTVKRFLAGAELPPDFDLNTWNERMVQRAQSRTLEDLLAGLQASCADPGPARLPDGGGSRRSGYTRPVFRPPSKRF
ncbi:MAG: maleylpyruvate isomerase N-terminal domain-containing protein [Anaerolineae bacterium]|nr:MAG: maleylpyruvate isomerase N-terminal domain-containing protein [Anaerolineae bacterium]